MHEVFGLLIALGIVALPLAIACVGLWLLCTDKRPLCEKAWLGICVLQNLPMGILGLLALVFIGKPWDSSVWTLAIDDSLGVFILWVYCLGSFAGFVWMVFCESSLSPFSKRVMSLFWVNVAVTLWNAFLTTGLAYLWGIIDVI